MIQKLHNLNSTSCVKFNLWLTFVAWLFKYWSWNKIAKLVGFSHLKNDSSSTSASVEIIRIMLNDLINWVNAKLDKLIYLKIKENPLELFNLLSYFAFFLCFSSICFRTIHNCIYFRKLQIEPSCFTLWILFIMYV